MTAADAAAMPHVVLAIASRADVDKRTVIKCLLGKSPSSTIWLAVDHAAQAMDVTGMPVPQLRPPRPRHACAACATANARILELEAEVARLRARPPKLAAVPTPAPETEHATG